MLKPGGSSTSSQNWNPDCETHCLPATKTQSSHHWLNSTHREADFKAFIPPDPHPHFLVPLGILEEGEETEEIIVETGRWVHGSFLGVFKTLHNKNFFSGLAMWLYLDHGMLWAEDWNVLMHLVLFLFSADPARKELLFTWCSFSLGPRKNTCRPESNLNLRAAQPTCTLKQSHSNQYLKIHR